jgi:hypothetical protein
MVDILCFIYLQRYFFVIIKYFNNYTNWIKKERNIEKYLIYKQVTK